MRLPFCCETNEYAIMNFWNKIFITTKEFRWQPVFAFFVTFLD